ncbi:MAG: hypothetical protein ABI417_19805 [Coleofasciculaceae cyanobacterium]
MNSDIDNNSDTLYNRLITWLLQESAPAASPSADGQEASPVPKGEQTAADFELDHLDLLDLEELNIAPNHTNEADNRTWAGIDTISAEQVLEPSADEYHSYTLGEMPTVQNRFQAILKRRLQVEIERHPPLFPWETEFSDYEPDQADAVADRWVPPVRLWMPQLSNLSLPVVMPEAVMAQLLEACSEAVYSRRQLGAKLVNVVENLFPNQLSSLNQLAGMVLLHPSRSGERLQAFAGSYETAATEQQMTLALLAAKEIISALTVPISPTQTPIERHWETSAGIVTVEADYQIQDGVSKLRVSGRLPRGGSLTLRTPQASAVSQRTYPGYLSVESYDLQPNQSYPLEIRFHDSEQTPLIFAICPTL